MRVSILFSLFMAFAAVGVNAKPTRTTAAMKRFGFKGDAAEENLTTAQRYARELTRRTPTRRCMHFTIIIDLEARQLTGLLKPLQRSVKSLLYPTFQHLKLSISASLIKTLDPLSDSLTLAQMV